MSLFINQYTKPIHVFDAPVGTGDIKPTDDTPVGESGLYEAAELADPETLCGKHVTAANGEGSPHERGMLRVTEMQRWDDLEAFVTDADLCEDCRDRLPEAWPASAEYLEDDDPELGELFG